MHDSGVEDDSVVRVNPSSVDGPVSDKVSFISDADKDPPLSMLSEESITESVENVPDHVVDEKG